MTSNWQPTEEPSSPRRRIWRGVMLVFTLWFAVFGMVGNLLQPNITRSLMEELAEHSCAQVAPRDASRRNARPRFSLLRKCGFAVAGSSQCEQSAAAPDAGLCAGNHVHRMRAGVAMRC